MMIRRKKWISFLVVVLVLLFCVPLGSHVRYRKPVIAVVASASGNLGQILVHVLNQYGADARLVDNNRGSVRDYDALVIPGGEDVDPAFYGQANMSSRNLNPNEDRLQMEAVRTFVQAKKPVLGICRGSQIINVALGGTLRQQIDGHMKAMRKVDIWKSSTFRCVLGRDYNGMHYHHQCIDKLADGLISTQADAVDGCLEGFQHQSLPVYGFQWHPEMTESSKRAVFRFFVHICELSESDGTPFH
ncbi:gamma-glutamyl-gamma-aminobutyrate hydrolase family protein [Bilifractor porci]|uniref:Glutamine amidotransferase n=1 Tax=Bilifractor porci TaxID=2606636 RepID=A0A7X2P956_9FIRM|nr:gamma-glutamyl-gamma-aminobutyrate hydrolase family protein [Bilifractor porci]MST82504.1 hypothetical protein [Bilifractor porci]